MMLPKNLTGVFFMNSVIVLRPPCQARAELLLKSWIIRNTATPVFAVSSSALPVRAQTRRCPLHDFLPNQPVIHITVFKFHIGFSLPEPGCTVYSVTAVMQLLCFKRESILALNWVSVTGGTMHNHKRCH